MQKKCTWVFWGLVCLLIAIEGVGFAAKASMQSTKVYPSPFMYATSENSLFICLEEYVIHHNNKDNYATQMPPLGKDVKHITAFDDVLYAYEEKETKNVFSLNRAGERVELLTLPSDCTVHQLEKNEDFLFLLMEQNGVRMLCTFKEGNQEVTPIEIEDVRWNNVITFCVSGKELFVYEGQSRVLSSFKYDQEWSVQYAAMICEEMDFITCSAAYTDHVVCYGYKVGVEKLWRIDVQSGEIALAPLKNSKSAVGLRCTKDKMYMMDPEKSVLLFTKISAVKEQVPYTKSLTLVDFFGMQTNKYEIAMEMFEQMHPDVKVIHREIFEPHPLATAIMSGLPGCDIVCLQEPADLMSFEQIYKSGATYNLYDFESIKCQPFAHSDIANVYRREDALLAIPESFRVTAFRVNKALLEKMDIQIPQKGWTWTELFALGEKVRAYNEKNQTSIVLLYDDENSCPYFFTQYFANNFSYYKGEANIYSETFQALVEQYCTLEKEGLIVEDGREDQIQKKNRALFSTYSMRNVTDIIHETLTYPPVFDQNTKYPARCLHIVLTKNAQEKEIAADFLACYISEEVLKECFFTDGIWLSSLDDYEMRANEKESMKRNEEKLMFHKEMMANCVPESWFGDFFYAFYKDLYPALKNGHVTVQQFLSHLQRKADMMLGE